MTEKEVEVELELTAETIVNLAMEAHAKDITLNQHINDILRLFVEDNIRKEEEVNG